MTFPSFQADLLLLFVGVRPQSEGGLAPEFNSRYINVCPRHYTVSTFQHRTQMHTSFSPLLTFGARAELSFAEGVTTLCGLSSSEQTLENAVPDGASRERLRGLLKSAEAGIHCAESEEREHAQWQRLAAHNEVVMSDALLLLLDKQGVAWSVKTLVSDVGVDTIAALHYLCLDADCTEDFKEAFPKDEERQQLTAGARIAIDSRAKRIALIAKEEEEARKAEATRLAETSRVADAEADALNDDENNARSLLADLLASLNMSSLAENLQKHGVRSIEALFTLATDDSPQSKAAFKAAVEKTGTRIRLKTAVVSAVEAARVAAEESTAAQDTTETPNGPAAEETKHVVRAAEADAAPSASPSSPLDAYYGRFTDGTASPVAARVAAAYLGDSCPLPDEGIATAQSGEDAHLDVLAEFLASHPCNMSSLVDTLPQHGVRSLEGLFALAMDDSPQGKDAFKSAVVKAGWRIELKREAEKSSKMR